MSEFADSLTVPLLAEFPWRSTGLARRPVSVAVVRAPDEDQPQWGVLSPEGQAELADQPQVLRLAADRLGPLYRCQTSPGAEHLLAGARPPAQEYPREPAHPRGHPPATAHPRGTPPVRGHPPERENLRSTQRQRRSAGTGTGAAAGTGPGNAIGTPAMSLSGALAGLQPSASPRRHLDAGAAG